MWGDSAGGQVLSRYALTTHLSPSHLRRTRILTSNPSSFPFPSGLRFPYESIEGRCELGPLAPPDASVVEACPDYNSWRYGLDGDKPPYVAEGLARGGAARLPSVDVTYLQGTKDVCNEDGTCAAPVCPSGGLDRSCAAMLQGPERLWRGRRYKAALDAHYGRPVNALVEMPGVAHDAFEVVRSPEFLAAAFDGRETEKPRREAAEENAAPAARAPAIRPANASWPTSFFASFVEDTWFHDGASSHSGTVAYLWDGKSAAQVIKRAVSKLNPICDEVRPNRSTPCSHHMVGASRYLAWPEEGECCLHCDHGCGALRPSWVDAVPSFYTGLRQVRGATCHSWLLQSGTPDRLATEVGSGRLCELYDGGADFTGDNPFSWAVDPATYSEAVPPRELELPASCSAARRC